MTDVNFPQDFYLDDVGVWRLKKEKLAELNKPKQMTNEEWFCGLSTEEKAEWLTGTFDLCGTGCSRCFLKDRCFADDGHDITEYLVKWLKEVYKE